ncbi:hypothetical protein D3C83_143650 [compost metagenome]
MAEDVVEGKRRDGCGGGSAADPDREDEERRLCRPLHERGQNLRVRLPVTSRRVP